MKASLTIEASLVVPVIMLIIAWFMGQTISLYQETVTTASISETLELEPVKEFRRLHAWKELGNK